MPGSLKSGGVAKGEEEVGSFRPSRSPQTERWELLVVRDFIRRTAVSIVE